MRILLTIFLLLLLQSTLSAQNVYQKPAFVFAAGNLKFVLPQIIKEFYIKHPDARVFIQYGSSGYLADEIIEGKSFDIYFAANIKYPQKIYDTKKSSTKPKIYAQGQLILFIPKNLKLNEEGLKLLGTDSIKNITVANKSSAPYGVAALEALKNSKCCTQVLNKVRYSSDVATAIDNVIWHGDAGFLSKSALNMIPDSRQEEGVDWIEVDNELYSPILQAYVISKNGLKNDNAIKFIKFLESEAGQKIFRDNGYKNIDPR